MSKVFHGLLTATAAAALTLVPVGAADAVGTTAQAGKVVHFTSPSGNIDCYLSSDRDFGRGVNCVAQKDRWKRHKPRPASCNLDWVPSEVDLSPNGKLRIGACRGDIGPVCGPKGSAEACSTLGYGERVRAGNIRCSSSRKGITCLTSDGAGFRVSRSGYVRLI